MPTLVCHTQLANNPQDWCMVTHKSLHADRNMLASQQTKFNQNRPKEVHASLCQWTGLCVRHQFPVSLVEAMVVIAAVAMILLVVITAAIVVALVTAVIVITRVDSTTIAIIVVHAFIWYVISGVRASMWCSRSLVTTGIALANQLVVPFESPHKASSIVVS